MGFRVIDRALRFSRTLYKPLKESSKVTVMGGRNAIHYIASNKHFSKHTPQSEFIANKYGLNPDADWGKVDIFRCLSHYCPAQYHEFVLKGMKAADAGGNQARFLQLFSYLFDQYIRQPLLQNSNMLNETGW